MSLKQLIRAARKPQTSPEQKPKADVDLTGCFTAPPCLGNGSTSLHDCYIQNRLSTPLPAVAVIPDFLNESDEQVCLSHVDAHAADKLRNVSLRGRTTQVWGGTVTTSGLTDAEPLPLHFARMAELFVEQDIFPRDKAPNHALVNSYERAGGIMPHTDGSAYHPIVAILSLNSPVVFDFHHKRSAAASSGPLNTNVAFSIYLPRRSLLVFSDDCYHHLYHGIEARLEDELQPYCADAPPHTYGVPKELEGKSMLRGMRTSITLRYVPLAH